MYREVLDCVVQVRERDFYQVFITYPGVSPLHGLSGDSEGVKYRFVCDVGDHLSDDSRFTPEGALSTHIFHAKSEDTTTRSKQRTWD